MGSESIAHSASWAIDSEPIRALGVIIVKYTLIPNPNHLGTGCHVFPYCTPLTMTQHKTALSENSLIKTANFKQISDIKFP